MVELIMMIDKIKLDVLAMTTYIMSKSAWSSNLGIDITASSAQRLSNVIDC